MLIHCYKIYSLHEAPLATILPNVSNSKCIANGSMHEKGATC